MSSSAIPKRFCGLRVLLIEPSKRLLQHHANILKHSSYRVTTTTKASDGLSMMNGHTYDCVLIDADMYATEMEAFLHQVSRNQPQISIILMASNDIHLKIPKEALKSEAIFCLLKPCSPMDICDIWKHICRHKENVSKEKLHKEVDDAMYKPVTYEDLFSDDDDEDEDSDDHQEDVDEIARKENIGIGTTKKADKGKQPFIRKRKNDEPVDDEKCPKKRKQTKTRVSWKGELDDKFRDAVKVLGENAHSSDILKHMNVPGLTRFHVASHLQKYQKKRRRIEATIAELAQRGNNLQVESFANNRCHYSTQSNVNESIARSSSLERPLMHNLSGIFYMAIENIRAKLQEAPSLPLQQLPTTYINNYGDNQTTDHSFWVVENANGGGQETEVQPICQDYENAMEPQVTGEFPLNGLDNGNFGDASGSGLSQVQEQFACFEPATEPWVADCGDIAVLLDHSQEDLALPDFLLCDSGGVLPSQDFQLTNEENLCPVFPDSTALFDIENCLNPGSSLDSIPFRPASADLSFPEFSIEESDSLAQIQNPVNSSVPLDGSEDRFKDNDLSQSDLEYAMSLLNDDDDVNFLSP